MDELTSVTVRTVGALMKLLTELGLVSRRNVLFLLEFVISVSESTSVTIWAISFCSKSSTKLGLNFNFVVLGHDSTVILESEWIVGSRLFNFVNSFKFLSC